LFADISVELVIDIRVSSRRGWMSGSRGVGVTGIVSAVVRGMFGHVFCGAGEEWRCRGCVVVVRWRWSESCPFGFILVVCKVMCLASGSTGEVSAAVGAKACILGG
jgi:hypothetical protein